VVVYYNFVYRRDQRDIHCFFAQAETNRSLTLARIMAEKIAGSRSRPFSLSLPPLFGQQEYPAPVFCGEAWNQLMVNPSGDVITCDVAGDSRESLRDKGFMDVWNGPYFTRIRRQLVEGVQACSRYCLRANAASVNELRSHIITRGKSDAELAAFLEGA
jgi:MoaA/NifB/PqqE/SkfB family radical SAM enzyme